MAEDKKEPKAAKKRSRKTCASASGGSKPPGSTHSPCFLDRGAHGGARDNPGASADLNHEASLPVEPGA